MHWPLNQQYGHEGSGGGNQLHQQGEVHTPHERTQYLDNKSKRVENTLLIILQQSQKQDRIIEWMKENVDVLK